MRTLLTVLLILAGILLIVSNPTREEFEEYAHDYRRSLLASMMPRSGNAFVDALSRSAGLATAEALNESLPVEVERQNFLFASIYRLGTFDGEAIRFLGIADRFINLDR